jgi:mRNA-degrading endonuclease RelE of RelBE toxin-antitoxin system
MNHRTLPRFWQLYRQLPKEARELADKNFDLLKSDPYHPSLHFKKVNDAKQLWSVRIGIQYRALGIEKPEGIVWIWIGTHAEYDKLLS